LLIYLLDLFGTIASAVAGA